MTSLYVAGPMTGYPEWNFPAFTKAAADLREHGFEVVSPHEIDLEEGFDPSSNGAGFDLRAALERDVAEVLDADGLALLDGWERSSGAVVEVLTAGSAGTPAQPVREWLAAAKGVAAAFVLAILALGSGAVALTQSDEIAEAFVGGVFDVVTEDEDDLIQRPAEKREERRERLVIERVGVLQPLEPRSGLRSGRGSFALVPHRSPRVMPFSEVFTLARFPRSRGGQQPS